MSTSAEEVRLDGREYKAFKLGNGLEALLIHDPEGSKEENKSSTKAAAAICISVGSFSDPKDAQGLAHLLEHMLHLGTSKFPEENDYRRFILQHGGSCNAKTWNDFTIYFFDIHQMHLKPAMDRFSQLFTCPLIKQESLDREIQVVDSEFAKGLHNDRRRLTYVQKGTASDPLHPYSRFSSGNLKSFKQCGDIRGKLSEFYMQHYIAQRMKLVVMSGESLETLQDWVCELFQYVREGPSEVPSFIWCNAEPIWPTAKLYRVESVRELKSLHLGWPMSPCLKGPCSYISSLLNDGGPGSLSKFLKLEGLVLSFAAKCTSSTSCPIYNVSMELTSKGLSHVYDIIGHLYEYINMLRLVQPQEWLLRIKKFRAVKEQRDVTKLAKNLHHFPIHQVIYGGYSTWDPELIKGFLGCLHPDHLRIDILSKCFDKNAQEVHLEPWYGVQYAVEDIPTSLLDKWRVAESLNIAFHLPPIKRQKNVIPKDSSVRSSAVITNQPWSQPIIFHEDATTKAWYKFDQKLNKRQANYYFAITCKMHDIREIVISKVYGELLNNSVNEIACMLGLRCSFSFSKQDFEHHIIFEFGGDRDKLPLLVGRVLMLLETTVFTEEHLKIIKERMKQNGFVTRRTFQTFLVERYSAESWLECLHSLQVEDLNTFFSRRLYDREGHMKALCHGNLSESQAHDLINITKKAVPLKPIEGNWKPERRTIKLLDTYNLFTDSTNRSEVLKIFQIERHTCETSVKTIATVSLFHRLIQEPFIQQLRTQNHFCYQIRAYYENTYGVVCFNFHVASSKYGPKHLEKEVDAFIDGLQGYLENMSEQDFEIYKNTMNQEKHKRLADETNEFWSQILEEDLRFDLH